MGFFKKVGKALGGVGKSILGGVGGTVLGLGSSLISGNQSNKAQNKAANKAYEQGQALAQQQEESQGRLNEQNAKLNYDYGEQAADAAHQRSLDLYNHQQETESMTAKFNEAKELGLNPLAFGGAGQPGNTGGGASGGGAGGQQGDATNYLGILSAMNQAKQVAAETQRTKQEAYLLSAQRKEIEARAEKQETESDAVKAKTPYEAEFTRQQGIREFIENTRKQWEDSGVKEEHEMDITRNPELGITHYIQTNSHFNNRLAGEIGDIVARGELNTEKKNNLWQELLNATKDSNSRETQAAAVKLAAEWTTGEYTNWKTWTGLATDALGTLTKLISLGK